MPERRSPTPAETAEGLVRDAAQRAVELALSGHEKATAEAVARALRDERVDGQLKRHEDRLNAINGSQERAAKALQALKGNVSELAEASKRHAAVAEALAQQTERQGAASLSKRARFWTVAGVLAAYLAVIVPLIYLLANA